MVDHLVAVHHGAELPGEGGDPLGELGGPGHAEVVPDGPGGVEGLRGVHPLLAQQGAGVVAEGHGEHAREPGGGGAVGVGEDTTEHGDLPHLLVVDDHGAVPDVGGVQELFDGERTEGEGAALAGLGGFGFGGVGLGGHEATYPGEGFSVHRGEERKEGGKKRRGRKERD